MFQRFKVIKDVGIEDDLTGQIHTNFRELCNVLNKIDERANKNAEEYYNMLNTKNTIKVKLKAYHDVTNKHNIYSANDLDETLKKINI